MGEELILVTKAHKEKTIFNVGEVKFGSDFVVIAGPCSVESENSFLEVALHLKGSGKVHMLRGGAWKPRSSPYSFQGLGEEALKIMKKARQKTGLPFVTECMDAKDLPLIEKYADMIQIGARNMQNFSLLNAVGKSKLPVILKRGLAATIDEWLASAEYIMKNGNEKVVLCERGIRSFDSKYTRNILDISAVPILRTLTHLPIIMDPSHAAGRRDIIPSLVLASKAVGADGIIVEVHQNPDKALSDGKQSLTFEGIDLLLKII